MMSWLIAKDEFLPVFQCIGDGNASNKNLMEFLPSQATFNDPLLPQNKCEHNSPNSDNTDPCEYAFFKVDPEGLYDYLVAFTLETSAGGLDKGQHILTEKGIQ